MSLLISASALMHIQQQFGDKAECTVQFTDEGAALVLDDGVSRYSYTFSLSHVADRKSGDILMKFVKDAKHYFAGSE